MGGGGGLSASMLITDVCLAMFLDGAVLTGAVAALVKGPFFGGGFFGSVVNN